MSDIGDRLRTVQDRLAAAAIAAGRRPEEVRLIGVSKRHPAESLREAYAAGLRDFGENYVQELSSKHQELADLPDLRFHLIGHLQSNKARQVVGVASLIHTVDGGALGRELSKRAGTASVPPSRRLPAWEGDGRLPVLVEVNIGREPQKAGCLPEELPTLLAALSEEPGLVVRGLMTIPPVTDSPAEARRYFEALRELREANGGVATLPELSMGMSDDFEEAIAAGATMVRIGTAIFGARILS